MHNVLNKLSSSWGWEGTVSMCRNDIDVYLEVPAVKTTSCPKEAPKTNKSVRWQVAMDRKGHTLIRKALCIWTSCLSRQLDVLAQGCCLGDFEVVWIWNEVEICGEYMSSKQSTVLWKQTTYQAVIPWPTTQSSGVDEGRLLLKDERDDACHRNWAWQCRLCWKWWHRSCIEASKKWKDDEQIWAHLSPVYHHFQDRKTAGSL